MYELKKKIWKGTDEEICWDRALVLWEKNLLGRGLTKVEKHWSTPPCAIQAKIGDNKKWKKLGVIKPLEKSERIIDIRWNARLTYSSICTICDNADRITGGARSGPNVLV